MFKEQTNTLSVQVLREKLTSLSRTNIDRVKSLTSLFLALTRHGNVPLRGVGDAVVACWTPANIGERAKKKILANVIR